MASVTRFLAAEFSERLLEAKEFAQAAEGSSVFVHTRRLYVYEAAYLLAFSAWENLLEQAFIRFLCGYENSNGPIAKIGNWTRPHTIADANALMLGRRPYLLWHNPVQVVSRVQDYFQLGPHESVLQSALQDLQCFAAVRHYIAHRNQDTRTKFDVAVTQLTGALIHGGRAGRFLRLPTIDPVSTLQVRWLDRICDDLERYAAQIAA